MKSYENVDARGQDPSGKQVVIGPAAAELAQAAFSAREGADSEILETPKSEYFVVHVDRITPSRPPVLSEVEAKVVEAWQTEQRRKTADQRIKDVVDKANAGGDLEALAKGLGADCASPSRSPASTPIPAITSPSRPRSSSSSWRSARPWRCAPPTAT